MPQVYDQAKDTEPFAFQIGMPIHLGRLAGATEMLLAHPDSEIIRAFASVALDQFKAWADECGVPTGMEPLDTEAALTREVV